MLRTVSVELGTS